MPVDRPIDLVVHDRPGWNSYTYNFPFAGAIQKRTDNEIVIRFDTADQSAINDDFYVEHHRQIVLSSRDGGHTWREIEPEWEHVMPLVLSDGALVQVVAAKLLRSRTEQRQRLESLGIEDVWRDDCKLVWDLWPESMAAELRARGLRVWDRKVGPSRFDRYLPDGIIATHGTSALVARVSGDGGKTWNERHVLEGEDFAHLVCTFAGSTVLPDNTILVPCYGERKERPDRVSEVFVLRSTDRGASFELVPIGGKTLNETCLVRSPSGGVVALIRGGGAIHRSISTDGGRSWSAPVETGMKGAPLHGICLQSGTLLCTYAHRESPGQIRATPSLDAGETWAVERTLVLRDGVPAQYTTLGGAGSFLGGTGSVQLDNGSIFTFYSLPRSTELRDGAVSRAHSVIAASLYREEFFPPAGFGAWGSTVPGGRTGSDLSRIPPEWKRVEYADDPWHFSGTVNTTMPPSSEEDRRRGFITFARHFSDPVLPETAPTPAEQRATLDIVACPGEYEPVSFCIRPLVDLEGVVVSVGTLRAEAGVIPASHVDLRAVRCLPYPFGPPADRTCALRPVLMETYRSADMAAGTTVQFWLTVKLPETARPGIYAADIVIRSTGRPSRTLPLRVEVLPFTLQSPPTTYAFYHLFTSRWRHYGHAAPRTLQRHCIDMAEHGMNGVVFYTLPHIERDGHDGQWRVDFDRPVAPFPHSFSTQLETYVATGLRRLVWYLGDLNLTIAPYRLRGGSAAMNEAYGAVVAAVERWRQSRSLSAIVYSPHDEIDASPARTLDALAYHGVLRQQKVPTFQTYIGKDTRRTESLPVVNVACFAGDVFRHEFIGEVKNTNPAKELWVYSGNARYGLDPKGERYFFGLFALAVGADGVAQWAYQSPPGGFGNGDANPFDMLEVGRRCHDHAFPTAAGLLPTIGLEGIREGIDDARYVHTLRLWIQRARASGKKPAVALAGAAAKQLEALLATIDINRENVHFLDDFPGFTRTNNLPCRKQPDAMTGADFDGIRRRWIEKIMSLRKALR